MKSIAFDCPHCKAFQTLILEDDKDHLNFDCPSCQKQIEFTSLDQNIIQGCPLCRCKDIHQHKDLNKKLGLTLFIIGALLAPWTYYASLIIALIIDAVLYPFFPWMQVCYRCHSEMRGWPKNEKLDRFNHEIGAHYEYAQENK